MRVVATAFLVAIAAPVVSSAAEGQPHECEHSGEKSFPSPDGRWIATVQEEVCLVGNSTAAGVMVDLASASDAKHAKRVFNMRVPRSRDYWPRVVWKGPTAMELWAPNRADIAVQVSSFDGVQIQLKYCGDNAAERAQVAEYQAAFEKWKQDTTQWVQKKKQDPGFSEPRPRRPEEPRYSDDSCANVGG